jgi:hypothetical protein
MVAAWQTPCAIAAYLVPQPDISLTVREGRVCPLLARACRDTLGTRYRKGDHKQRHYRNVREPHGS